MNLSFFTAIQMAAVIAATTIPPDCDLDGFYRPSMVDPLCVACPPGFYCRQGTLFECPLGEIAPNEQSTACIACSIHSVPNANRTRCEVCQENETCFNGVRRTCPRWTYVQQQHNDGNTSTIEVCTNCHLPSDHDRCFGFQYFLDGEEATAHTAIIGAGFFVLVSGMAALGLVVLYQQQKRKMLFSTRDEESDLNVFNIREETVVIDQDFAPIQMYSTSQRPSMLVVGSPSTEMDQSLVLTKEATSADEVHVIDNSISVTNTQARQECEDEVIFPYQVKKGAILMNYNNDLGFQDVDLSDLRFECTTRNSPCE